MPYKKARFFVYIEEREFWPESSEYGQAPEIGTLIFKLWVKLPKQNSNRVRFNAASILKEQGLIE
jgi:hypothetical protein